MHNTIQMYKDSAVKWRSMIGKKKGAEDYYRQTRNILMNESLPDKAMEITVFKLLDKTEPGKDAESLNNAKFYSVAILKGFIPKEMVADCLTAIKEKLGNKLACVPDGTFFWDEEELDWIPIEKSELAEFCLQSKVYS